MSKYNSSKSTAHRKPVVLDSSDPRNKNAFELEKFRSRIGSKVIVKDFNSSTIELEEYAGIVWQLNGSAQEISPGYYRYVYGQNSLAGNMWSKGLYSLPVTISCTVNQPVYGGDGYCIAIEDASSPDTNLGAAGGRLGLASSPYRSWGVAFDNWTNLGQQTSPLIAPFDSFNTGGGDGVFIYYDYYSLTQQQIQGTHNVSVIFSKNSVTVYYDGVLVLQSSSNLSELPSGNVRIGFSAATGSAVNTIDIYNILAIK